MAQRKCTYPGEYAPEALDVITEYDDDDNPDFLQDMKAENEASGEFTSVKVVTIDVDDKAINDVLFPSQKPIIGTVVNEDVQDRQKMNDYQTRKARRTAEYKEWVEGWKLRTCSACSGSGHYDHNGSPKCSACNGTGKERYKPSGN